MLFRAILTSVFYGQICQNSMHFFKTGGTWPADGTALTTDLRDNFISGTFGIRGNQMNTLGYTRIDVYNVASGLSPVTLAISLNGLQAASTGTGFGPINTILQIRAIAGGRRGRGRIYMAAPFAGCYGNGVMTPTGLTNWTTSVNGINGRYCGVSHTSAFDLVIATGNNQVDYYTADHVAVANTPGIQRRRNVGVGI